MKAGESLFEQWHDDPDLFDRDIWPEDLPEKWQTEASRLVSGSPRIAIRSGHGVGKTAWLARRIIWWGLTRHPWKIGCTAPSSSTLFDALWSDLAKWHSTMPAALSNQVACMSDRYEWV